MTSIKKIAEIAGVSRGTVDRALNNRGGVNEDVANRIRSIAKDLGYKTNRAGLALAARKHPLKIGAIFPSDGNPYFEDVISGMRAAEKEYADFGVSVSLKTTKGFNTSSQLRHIDALVEEGVQAIILSPVNDLAIANRIKDLLSEGIPVITANTDLEKSDRLCYVGTDYFKSGKMAGGLMGLMAAGRRMRIVILTGSIHVLGHNQSVSGFYSAIKSQHPNLHVIDVEETLDNSDISYELTRRLLSSKDCPDAIYMTAGAVYGACRAIEEADMAGKIILLTHDFTGESRGFLEKRVITASIPQDPYQQGYLPVKLLFDYSLDKEKPQNDRVYTNSYITIPESI